MTGIVVHPRLRNRVEEALVCPYCRDLVSRRGVVACARRGCGALYHRECWDECSQRYGGCAVFGCESRRTRELSVAGFMLRLARLVVAALLFPRRIVREVHVGNVGVSVAEAVRAHVRCFREDLVRHWYWPFALIVVPPILISVIGFTLADELRIAWLFVPGFVWAVPYVLAFVLLGLLYGTLALVNGFSGELNALHRADVGTTVLGAMRSVKPKA